MKIQKTNQVAFGLLKAVMISLILWACTDANVTPNSNQSVKGEDLASSTLANGSINSLKGNYNLEVILHGDGNASLGHVKFRQYMNEIQMIHLGVWVRDLEPNTSYVLQRAVDVNIDGNCTGINWLTLGAGLVPQSIVTDDKGTGEADLFRSIAAIPVGSTFDIHFRILKETTSEEVLTSDCYQYTVH